MRVMEEQPVRYDALVQTHRAALHRLAYRVVGDHGAAEEIVQDSFGKLAGAPVLTRPDDEVAAWLRRVTLNGAFNRSRSERRAAANLQRVAALRTVPADDSPLTSVVAQEERERVREILASLPERQRAVLLLRAAGHSYAEIAATVEIAVGSVGVLLARGERAFREVYESMSAGDQP